MNRVFFTKKHIAILIGIALVFIIGFLSCWFLVLSPKMNKLSETSKRFSALNENISKLDKDVSKLNKNPTLLESSIINEAPIVPNGIELESYFNDLEMIDSSTSISFKNIKFEDSIVFPENPSAEKQLRKSDVGFDVVSDSSKDVVNFVDHLELGNRFMKVKNVSYRASDAQIEEGSYSYSATIITEMYYLSTYETGKELK
ncbi:hypothetical protein ABG953_12525 [Enterococcus faecalis]|uniref:hypothetical protein n=1 Tax=Enterococcus faecalis TaxID=1351 RepID=UPI0019E7026F|nr:hypothetical protein [Enterococcus faecalis]EGO6705181.1 hypothetical protein [Enterococcus faecalis]